ncbi:hypothetical protein ACX40Y_02760 [Sphingomonas sp. RS6]
MLKRIVLTMAATAAPLLLAPAEAHAQNAAQNGVLIIYGDDKCPTNKNGEEIVVCQRLDEAERFRIPKTLRDQPGAPQKTESWAVRSQDALTTGDFGAGSCTTVGAASATGCFVRQATKARAERRAQKKAETDLPLP